MNTDAQKPPRANRRAAHRAAPEPPGEYAAQPVPRQPLPVPLPPGYRDDPDYLLRPYATAGTLHDGAHIGVLGRMARGGEKIAVCYDRPFVHGYFGPPGYGKTYGDGCHVENVLLKTPYLNRLVRPYCVISLHYEYGRSHPPELLASRLPNRDPGEVGGLIHDYGSLPQGLPDGVCLTLAEHVAEHRARFPHWQVHPLLFSPASLGLVGLKALMGYGGDRDPLAAAYLENLLRDLPQPLTIAKIERALSRRRLPGEQVRRALQGRFLLARPFLDDRALPLRGFLRAGRLICVDLRDGWLAPQKAMCLFAALNYAIFLSGERDDLPCDLLLCVEETHKLMREPALAAQFEYLVREHRHLRVSMILSSQDPLSVPRAVLSQLDVVGVYRLDAQRWLDCLAMEVAAFRGVRVEEFTGLLPGQLVLWARQWAAGVAGAQDLTGELVLVNVRQRLSHHGGPR